MRHPRFFPLPCLVLVTDRALCNDAPLAEKVAQAVAGGVNVVQLREKDPDGRSLPAGELLRLALRLRQVTAGRALPGPTGRPTLGPARQALFLVNDRLDVALAANADGVHLPEKGLPVAEARRLLGRDHLIGCSVHSVAAALRAQEEGADYVQVGTIYPTRSHPDVVPAGPGLIREVAQQVRIPILAVGGVTAEKVPEVIAAGAAGAAVISAILASPSPRHAAEELWQAIQSAWPAWADRSADTRPR